MKALCLKKWVSDVTAKIGFKTESENQTTAEENLACMSFIAK